MDCRQACLRVAATPLLDASAGLDLGRRIAASLIRSASYCINALQLSVHVQHRVRNTDFAEELVQVQAQVQVDGAEIGRQRACHGPRSWVLLMLPGPSDRGLRLRAHGRRAAAAKGSRSRLRGWLRVLLRRVGCQDAMPSDVLPRFHADVLVVLLDLRVARGFILLCIVKACLELLLDALEGALKLGQQAQKALGRRFASIVGCPTARGGRGAGLLPPIAQRTAPVTGTRACCTSGAKTKRPKVRLPITIAGMAGAIAEDIVGAIAWHAVECGVVCAVGCAVASSA